MHTKVIQAEVVSAYSHCPRKAFLLHCTEDRGTPNDYASILEKRASAHRASYLAKLQRTSTSTCSYNDRAMSSGIEVLTEATLEAANVAAYCDALRIVGQRGDPIACEPTIVVGTYRVEKQQMLNLAVVGYALGRLQGRPPATGCLITIDGECHRVNLRPMDKTVSSILERIRGWCGEPPTQPPPVVLNRHCPYTVSTGIKRTHLYRFCSQSKTCHRRGCGMHSKIVSKFCLASGRLMRYDPASAKWPCTLWTESACFAGPMISTVAANANFRL